MFKQIKLITLISGSNRKDNITQQIAAVYRDVLTASAVNFKYLSLETVSMSFISPGMYDNADKELEQIQEEYLIPADKLIFLIPEYNGSLPGVLKAFIDGCDVKKCFYNKKACLTGVSVGRAGNLRGMDHFSLILQHLKMTVIPASLPISKVDHLLDEKGQLTDHLTYESIKRQITQFIKF